MRQIEVEVEVFALIWSHRKPPETNENEILKRILADLPRPGAPEPARRVECQEEATSSNAVREQGAKVGMSYGKIRWVDDVSDALRKLGGVASLQQIYQTVEEIRHSAGRSTPETLEATVRRTIEDHSSDSENFRGTDLFRKIARGEWALKEWAAKNIR